MRCCSAMSCRLSLWPKLAMRNEIYIRQRLIGRQRRPGLIGRQRRRRMIAGHLDDAELGQPLNVIVGIAIGMDRAQGGRVPERLVLPCNCRGDPDACQCKQGGQKGSGWQGPRAFGSAMQLPW